MRVTKIQRGATYVLTVDEYLTPEQAIDMRVALEAEKEAYWVIVGGFGNE